MVDLLKMEAHANQMLACSKILARPTTTRLTILGETRRMVARHLMTTLETIGLRRAVPEMTTQRNPTLTTQKSQQSLPAATMAHAPRTKRLRAVRRTAVVATTFAIHRKTSTLAQTTVSTLTTMISLPAATGITSMNGVLDERRLTPPTQSQSIRATR